MDIFMSLLTIIFLTYTVATFGGKLYVEKIVINFYTELIERLKERGCTDVRPNFFEKCESFKKLIVISVIGMILAVLELIYICFAIKYDPLMYIAIGYFIYDVTNIIVARIKNKNQFTFNDINKYNLTEATEKLEEQINKLYKFKAKNLINQTLDLLYFGYMFYAFFIR